MTKLSKSRLLRGAVFTGMLMALVGAVAPAKADDGRWREHEHREADWRRHHEYERHWDHRYWRGDRWVYEDGYAPPPPVYYQPAPPPGVSFMFGFH